MRRSFGVLFLLSSAVPTATAQHIYPEKFDDCHPRSFCLDCGTPPTSFPNVASYFRSKLPPDAIKPFKGMVLVQVLVDSAGHACALSQASNLGAPALKQLDLRGLINTMPAWSPALDKSKPVWSSTTLRFDFNNGQLAVTYRRYDPSKESNAQSVGTVKITNQRTTYAPPPASAKVQVFTKQNSVIPWDMMRVVFTDRDNIIWVGTDNGLVKIDHDQFTLLNASNSGLQKKGSGRVGIHYGTTDTRNNKWLVDGYRAYRFDGRTWASFDSTSTPLRWTTALCADRQGNVWFGTQGLVKYDGQTWTHYTPQNSKMPAGPVSGLYADRQNRLWVGTFRGGNWRLAHGQWEELNSPATPLATASLVCADEDADGTLWVGLYHRDRGHSGLARHTPDGKWTTFTIDNSGLPSNEIEDLVVDQQHHVVWLSLNAVGLCRYDGTTWTVFTPENSAIPSTVISQLALDADGTLWGATFAGLFKLAAY